ncbi:transglutaminase-like domain-containing protein [Maribellus sp. YY47]|uniref:transglutaminase-like domain-containing protein n=1 Tax=Maribellus sp. YY47 TaxID=2929486 RepID=UPI002001603A|nr:transglutaminase-like domain-containing protein [Maribellus sp. YY47]MCK3686039.1 transglutaminase-like domain-containing protein [Maribellus sp. YY47]
MKSKLFGILLIGLISGACAPLARMLNYSPSAKVKKISFSDDALNPKYTFFYSDTLNNSYLRELRQSYEIDRLAASYDSEIDKIKAVLNWSATQWEHNGSNSPSNPDALTILKEARNGRQFRCVEYGILASSCLNSIGIPARVLGLKTRDVEKVRMGAGHVVTEAYSQQYNKWIFMDPQMNMMPLLHGIPLNAVEFQEAIISNRESIEMVNMDGNVSPEDSQAYIDWIGKYLFYFDVLFDQQIKHETDYKSIDGKTKLMLVPLGEKEPTVFQRSNKINYCFYTHSLKDFYQKPKV